MLMKTLYSGKVKRLFYAPKQSRVAMGPDQPLNTDYSVFSGDKAAGV